MPIKLADQALNGYVDEESNRMKTYFPFWTDTDILDLKKRARNYIIHDVLKRSSGGRVTPFDERHMAIRKRFGRAWFTVNTAEVEWQKHPYSGFEALTSGQYPDKVYSLHNVLKMENTSKADELRGQMRDYLNWNEADKHGAIASEWCNFCVHRGTCMEPFANGKK